MFVTDKSRVMFVKLWLPVNIYNRIQRKRDVIRLIDSTMAHNDGLKELEVGKVFTIIDNYPY